MAFRDRGRMEFWGTVSVDQISMSGEAMTDGRGTGIRELGAAYDANTAL
jgi:hypothetical protein